MAPSLRSILHTVVARSPCAWTDAVAQKRSTCEHGATKCAARYGMVWGGCSSLRVCACVCAALSCYLSSSSSSLSPVNERDRWCTAPLHPAGSHRVTRWANGRATSTCGGDEEVSRLLRMPPAAAAGARDRLGRTLTMVMVGTARSIGCVLLLLLLLAVLLLLLLLAVLLLLLLLLSSRRDEDHTIGQSRPPARRAAPAGMVRKRRRGRMQERRRAAACGASHRSPPRLRRGTSWVGVARAGRRRGR